LAYSTNCLLQKALKKEGFTPKIVLFSVFSRITTIALLRRKHFFSNAEYHPGLADAATDRNRLIRSMICEGNLRATSAI